MATKQEMIPETVVALPGYVVFKEIKTGERKVGNIVLPDNAQQQPTMRVEVLDYGGPGPDEPDLAKVFGLAPGMIAITSQYAGSEVKLNGESEAVKICRQQDVLGVIVPADYKPQLARVA